MSIDNYLTCAFLLLLFFSRVHVRATLANTEARAELFTPRGSSSAIVHLPTVEITVRQQVSQ